MSSNPCNYMDYGAETIKRQTRAAYGCLVADQSPWATGWTVQSISCTHALSVTQKRRCSCGKLLAAPYECHMSFAFVRCRAMVSIRCWNWITCDESVCSQNMIVRRIPTPLNCRSMSRCIVLSDCWRKNSTWSVLLLHLVSGRWYNYNGKLWKRCVMDRDVAVACLGLK